MGQTDFFDLERRLDAISAKSDPLETIKRLVEPATLGDPMRPLIWVSKSMEK